MRRTILILLNVFLFANLFAQDTTYIKIQDSTYKIMSAGADVFVNSDSIAHLKHLHPFPLELAKIKVGYSNDSLVKKMFGWGFFDPDDGHAGARYFFDADKKVILKTVIGVDNIIEEVDLTSVDFPFENIIEDLSRLKLAGKLSTNPTIIHNIELGDSPEKILRAFGVPNSDVTKDNNRMIEYNDSHEQWDEVLFYSATFDFINNKLQRISIYNGD